MVECFKQYSKEQSVGKERGESILSVLLALALSTLALFSFLYLFNRALFSLLRGEETFAAASLGYDLYLIAGKAEMNASQDQSVSYRGSFYRVEPMGDFRGYRLLAPSGRKYIVGARHE